MNLYNPAVAKTACRVIALDNRQFRAGLLKNPAFALNGSDATWARARALK